MIDVDLDARYAPSNDTVARVIEGELIIVPLVAGIGDLDDELFSVNGSGKVIWDELDGKKSLGQIVQVLADRYSSPREEIETDVMCFVGELIRKKMIVDARTSKTLS